MKTTRLSAKQNSGEQLMRPGQQNKRGRGRGNNNNNNNNGGGNNNFNRKGGNPLTRTYDSSGPDVKIRGTAQHIAEKYAALARDAQSSGDRVIAENYLQHAEHYNRIIAAAQAQMQERFQRDDRADYNAADTDDEDVNDGDDVVVIVPPQQSEQPERAQRQEQPERQERTERNEQRPNRRERPDRRERQERQVVSAEPAAPVYDASSAPQPVIEGTPLEVAVEEEQQQAEATAAPAAERATKSRRSAAPRQRRPRRAAADENAEGTEAPAGEDAAPATLESAAE